MKKESQISDVFNNDTQDINKLEKLLKDYGISQDKIDEIRQSLEQNAPPEQGPQEIGLPQQDMGNVPDKVSPALKPGKPLNKISIRVSAKNII